MDFVLASVPGVVSVALLWATLRLGRTTATRRR